MTLSGVCSHLVLFLNLRQMDSFFGGFLEMFGLWCKMFLKLKIKSISLPTGKKQDTKYYSTSWHQPTKMRSNSFFFYRFMTQNHISSRFVSLLSLLDHRDKCNKKTLKKRKVKKWTWELTFSDSTASSEFFCFCCFDVPWHWRSNMVEKLMLTSRVQTPAALCFTVTVIKRSSVSKEAGLPVKFTVYLSPALFD